MPWSPGLKYVPVLSVKFLTVAKFKLPTSYQQVFKADTKLIVACLFVPVKLGIACWSPSHDTDQAALEPMKDSPASVSQVLAL